MNQKTKQIIIILIIIVISFIGYKMYFVSPDPAGTALVAEKAATSQLADGQIILTSLSRLEKVKLDESIFSNEVFNSLVNFERPIEPQTIGRPNPFLPIGR